ncbi:MAG: ABC transporter permease [Oscillospiraceae bacterium]|jgi:ribose transport system permease protein|nr:ABC transporter permease [Oscillospiraceae bacterium]
MQQESRIKKLTSSKSFLLLAITAVVLIITALVTPGAFNVGNARQILSTLSYTGIFLVGVACLLLSGGIDFSTSAAASVGMLLFAQLLTWFPTLPWPVAALGTVAFGVIAGGINAFFANGLNLMPFICTIGMSSVWSGLASWYTRGQIMPIRNTSFNGIAASYIGKSPIPWVFIFTIAVIAVYSVIIKSTRFGRSVLMVGGNPTAARLAGLNPKKIKNILFINNGVLASIGGLIWASQMKMGSPSGLVSAAPEMTALTASILGGVSFMGGAGSLGGAFCGVILIQVLAYALQVMGLPVWIITFVNGSLLVVALTIDNYATQRRLKKLGIRSTGSSGGMVMPGAK